MISCSIGFVLLEFFFFVVSVVGVVLMWDSVVILVLEDNLRVV